MDDKLLHSPATAGGTRGDEAASVERRAALTRLKKRRDFFAHLLVYVLVNASVIVVWATGSHGFLWPMFLLLFWGIGLVMNAWDVWHGDDFTDDAVDREIARMHRHGR